MIRAFSSAAHARRRPVPVNTSTLRTGFGLDLGKSSVSDTCPTRSIQQADIHSSASRTKRGVKRPLTLRHCDIDFFFHLPRGLRPATIVALSLGKSHM